MCCRALICSSEYTFCKCYIVKTENKHGAVYQVVAEQEAHWIYLIAPKKNLRLSNEMDLKD